MLLNTLLITKNVIGGLIKIVWPVRSPKQTALEMSLLGTGIVCQTFFTQTWITNMDPC